MYEVRELLELHALKLAWPHLDQQEISRIEALAARAKPESNRDWPNRCLEFDGALHRFWTQRSGYSWLQAELERFYQFLRIFQSWRGRDQQALAEAYAEHVAILDAIKKRDQSGVLALLREHIRNSAQLLQKAMPKAHPTPGSKGAPAAGL